MLNTWKSATCVAFTSAKSLLNKTPNVLHQQARTTLILKRQKPLKLYKKGGQPHKFNKNDFYYDLVENTNLKTPAPLDIILTQFVEGVGEKGQKITLKPQKAYNEFLLPGLAVYASPENLAKYLNTKITQKTYSSLNVPITLNYLRNCCLIVNMSVENPWVLEKWHIRANFRKYGVICTDDSITMPEKEIRGPNLDNEGKEFYITVTINKTESTPVRCKLHHDSFEFAKQLPEVANLWSIPGEPIFPEDREVLESLPRPTLQKSEGEEE